MHLAEAGAGLGAAWTAHSVCTTTCTGTAYVVGARRGGGQARRQDIAHGETDAELHVRDFDLSFDRASSHNVWLISGSRNWQRVERELNVFVLQ